MFNESMGPVIGLVHCSDVRFWPIAASHQQLKQAKSRHLLFNYSLLLIPASDRLTNPGSAPLWPEALFGYRPVEPTLFVLLAVSSTGIHTAICGR